MLGLPEKLWRTRSSLPFILEEADSNFSLYSSQGTFLKDQEGIQKKGGGPSVGKGPKPESQSL